MLNVQPERVMIWFAKQRSKGTCTCILQTAERETKVHDHILYGYMAVGDEETGTA